jgi:hypothetical protein
MWNATCQGDRPRDGEAVCGAGTGPAKGRGRLPPGGPRSGGGESGRPQGCRPPFTAAVPATVQRRPGAWAVRLCAVLAAFFAAAVSCADAPQAAWREDFNDLASPQNAHFFYEDRGSGKSGDDVIIRGVSGGILRYGLKYDATRKQDRYNMLLGDCFWWQGMGTTWGPFELKSYPFIEMKWRGDSFEFWYCVETAAGKRTPTYTWLKPERTEKDPQGRDWNISILRVAPDSSVPTANTPVRLVGLNLCPYSPREGKDLAVEIDYIEVRAATAAEEEQERKIVATFKDFPTGHWRGLETFFPFGTYFFYKRGDFESWNGGDDYEGAYGALARHRLNYVVFDDTVEIGRFNGQLEDAGRRNFLAEMNRLVQSARATGMKTGVGLCRLLDGRDLGAGYQQLLPLTREVTSAFPDDDVVVSWYVYDEPSAANLLSIAMITRALRETDPLQRPEMVVFNNTAAAESYVAYLSLCFWDNYPVLEGSRDPWAIRALARDYRRVLPGRPMWVTLPAFETIPPAPQGSYLRPSDAEMRLMSYLALAEGAKGLVWFVDWMNEGNLVGFLDRVGQPRGGMAATLEDLSRRLVPLGKLLLATDPLDTATAEVKQLDAPAAGKGVAVSILQHRRLPISYLVAVNEDLDHFRSAQATLPAAVLGAGCGVYDLQALDGDNLLQGNVFNVGPLAGGDGRIYLVAKAREFRRQKAAIQCETALEDLRVLTPDLSIARRWQVDLGETDAAIARCRRAAEAGDGEKALALSQQVAALLDRAMDSHSRLNAARHALADMRVELAEVATITEYPSRKPRWWTGRDHPMSVPNPGFLDLSKRYWEVGRAYRDLYSRYLKGESEGFAEHLSKARLDCLKMREDVLAMLRKKLEPAE